MKKYIFSSILAWKILWTEEAGGIAWWYIAHGVTKKSDTAKQQKHIQRVKMKVAQSCPTLCNPMDYTVHGILQARILEWVAFPFSRGCSQPRDWIQVSCIAGGFFTSWATTEAQEYWSGQPIPSPVDLPNPGIELGSPALQVGSLPTELWGKPLYKERYTLKYYMYTCGGFILIFGKTNTIM